jgi:2-C-methyl-D-erythritol 2,4-cyclodiphosphate synthase
MKLRVGQGIDVHPYEVGRVMRLCGVEIPCEVGLKGHSDADAAIHALVDALLGAAGKGDIGCLFPDTDPQWKGKESTYFLRTVWMMLRQEGWELQNIDLSILAEKPKIKPYVEAMKKCLASILELDASQIGIKATTTERLGFVGREEGLVASAVVLLSQN